MMRNYKINMGKKKKTVLLSVVSKRAWRLLRSALVFVRKGGAFKRSLLLALKLSGGAGQHNNRLHYFEREFSFNETPSFRFKLHRRRPHMIPCINPPHAAFYYSSEDDEDASCTTANIVFNGCNANHDHNLIEEDYNIQLEGKGKGEEDAATDDEQVHDEQDQIDSKAEEFIAKFYEGMKFQRQLSLIQYNEMLLRSIS